MASKTNAQRKKTIGFCRGRPLWIFSRTLPARRPEVGSVQNDFVPRNGAPVLYRAAVPRVQYFAERTLSSSIEPFNPTLKTPLKSTFPMKLAFATHNPNKIKEIAPLLPENIELLSLSDIGCDEEIMETADSIRGNALLKASYVRKNYGLNCFSDDTGLEVDALGGAPGVYSARYAGPQKNDADNVRKLLKNLKGISHREAR